jgi:hypothetical protein
MRPEDDPNIPIHDSPIKETASESASEEEGFNGADLVKQVGPSEFDVSAFWKKMGYDYDQGEVSVVIEDKGMRALSSLEETHPDVAAAVIGKIIPLKETLEDLSERYQDADTTEEKTEVAAREEAIENSLISTIKTEYMDPLNREGVTKRTARQELASVLGEDFYETINHKLEQTDKRSPQPQTERNDVQFFDAKLVQEALEDAKEKARKQDENQ